MNWLKNISSAVWIGVLGFLAYMAVVQASKHKKTADKLKIVAEDEKIVNDNIKKANEALSQAKVADSKAKAAKKKAKQKIDKIGKSNEDISSILNNWRS